jgi:putative phosphoribosyl transferase
MFNDRFDAAEQLVLRLEKYKDNLDVVIVAIPRGGLELGYVLSHKLHAPLDVIFTKKIGYPGNPEYAIGAVGIEGELIDKRLLGISDTFTAYLEHEIKRLRSLLRQRYKAYRGDLPPLDLRNKIVIVTDDGVATGKTLEITLDLIKKHEPQKIVVALPVAPSDAVALLKRKADEVVVLDVPELFFSVGQFYRNFEQVDDSQAIKLLHEAYTA